MIKCSCCEDKKPCAAKISIFRQLDYNSLEEISRIAIHREMKKGEMVMTPDGCQGLYLISEGRIKVYELTPSGKEYLLKVLQKGDFVGEEALFAQQEECNTYGQALTDGRVCFIARKDFLSLLAKYHSITLKLLEEFSRRMRQNAQQIVSNTEPVGTRLAGYLLNLSAAEDKDSFEIPLQWKELSSYLNTTPETISRKLKELEKRQIIRRKRRSITILKKQDLQEYTKV